MLRPSLPGDAASRPACRRRRTVRDAHGDRTDLHAEPRLDLHGTDATRGGRHRPGGAGAGRDLHGGAVPGRRLPHRGVRAPDDSQRPALGRILGAACRGRWRQAGCRGGIHRHRAQRLPAVLSVGVAAAVPPPVRHAPRPGATWNGSRYLRTCRTPAQRGATWQPWHGRYSEHGRPSRAGSSPR